MFYRVVDSCIKEAVGVGRIGVVARDVLCGTSNGGVGKTSGRDKRC